MCRLIHKRERMRSSCSSTLCQGGNPSQNILQTYHIGGTSSYRCSDCCTAFLQQHPVHCSYSCNRHSFCEHRPGIPDSNVFPFCIAPQSIFRAYQAFSMLITLNEHASTAVLKVELLPSFFPPFLQGLLSQVLSQFLRFLPSSKSMSTAGVVVTSFVTILEVPSVIEINVHGTYHGEGHNEEDNCKYVLDHHFCFECVG
uniref:Uncharacterized protein n=2 Tax=Ditylum brightwellii TaxID=49249 RepID=A0A7S4VRT2_9STRA